MAHHPAAYAVEAAPIVIPQGADFSIGWLYAEGDPAAAPASWPGSWTARMEIRETRGGDLLARLHSSITADGVITLGTTTAAGVDGVTDGATIATITAAINDTVSAAWTWVERPFPFDLELAGPGGRVIRLVEGQVILSAEVTTGA
jgi:hypothetical protein